MNVHSCSMAYPAARSGRQPATLAEHTALRSTGRRSSQRPGTAPGAPLSSDDGRRTRRPGSAVAGAYSPFQALQYATQFHAISVLALARVSLPAQTRLFRCVSKASFV